VSFREALKTLAHSADQGGGMLDFAHFNCAACHHELESPSWRQARGYLTTPGRPLPSIGPSGLLRAVLQHAADAEPPVPPLKQLATDFDAKYAALMKAFGARPFGDPAAIVAAARDATTWGDAFVKGLESVRYDDRQTARFLKAVADAARRQPASLAFDDAQQLLWAFDVLHTEVKGLKPEVAAAMQQLAGPNQPLMLRLAQPNQPRPLIADELADRLRRVASYRPERFREGFERIATLLSPE
jgi:hypothetical protein